MYSYSYLDYLIIVASDKSWAISSATVLNLSSLLATLLMRDDMTVRDEPSSNPLRALLAYT